jgi:dihydrofolate reductase
MIISCIVATAKNRVIGLNNRMPWHLPADLAYFKRTTMGHHIILGRKNYLAIGRPLPGRTNIILTRNPEFTCNLCEVVHTLEDALYLAHQNGEKEVFIIGGGTIYEQTTGFWDRLYLTEIDLETEGDVFFPEITWDDWQLISEEIHEKDPKNPYEYTFRVFERKNYKHRFDHASKNYK